MFRTSKILVLVAVVAFAMMLSVSAQADSTALSFWYGWPNNGGSGWVAGYSTSNTDAESDLIGYNFSAYTTAAVPWNFAVYGTADVANWQWYLYGANDQPVAICQYAGGYIGGVMLGEGESALYASTTKQSMYRWTASVAGTYQINGVVKNRWGHPQAYQISVNANQVLSRGWTPGTGDDRDPSLTPFSYTVTLAAGDTVDFMARANPNPSAIGPVIFDAVITDVVPEPGSMLLLGMGVVGLAARLRARRK